MGSDASSSHAYYQLIFGLFWWRGICRRLDCAYAIVVVVEEDVSSCSEILLLTR